MYLSYSDRTGSMSSLGRPRKIRVFRSEGMPVERLSAEAFASSVQGTVFDYKVARVRQVHDDDGKSMKRALTEARNEGFEIIGSMKSPPFVLIFFARLNQGSIPPAVSENYRIESVITVDLPKNEVFERYPGWEHLHIKRWTAFDLESFQANVCVTFFVQEVGG